MNGPTIRPPPQGSTRLTSNPPRSRLRASTTWAMEVMRLASGLPHRRAAAYIVGCVRRLGAELARRMPGPARVIHHRAGDRHQVGLSARDNVLGLPGPGVHSHRHTPEAGFL